MSGDGRGTRYAKTGKHGHMLYWAMCGMGLLLIVLPGGAATGAAPDRFVRREFQTGTATPASTIVFEDDFATYSSRWHERESPKASVAYRDGALALRVVSPGVAVWSVPDFSLALDAYTLQMTASVVAGSADSWFGCLLAYEDDEDFYAFLVSGEGDWQFVRYDAGTWIDLTPQEAARVMLAGEVAGDPLLLRVDVAGRVVNLWVDEQHAGTVTPEDDLHGAGFGVIARAGHGYVEVTFDTVVVSEFDRDMERGTSN